MVSVAASSILLLLLGCSAATPLGSSQTDCDLEAGEQHDYFIGRRQFPDELLYVEHVQVSGVPMRKVYATVPFRMSASLITYVEALDMSEDGTGACMYIAEGAVGSSNVTVAFSSQTDFGIDHRVGFYGLPME